MDFFAGVHWLNHGYYPNYNHRVAQHFKGYYGISYLHSGQLQFSMTNHKAMVFDAPVAWLTYPGPYFRFGAPSENDRWDYRFLFFTGPRIEQYVGSGLLPIHFKPPVFKITQPERFRGSFDEQLSFLSNGNFDQDRAVYMLEGILLLLKEQIDLKDHPDAVSRKVVALHEKIALDCERPWDFKLEASRLGISYSHFRKVFKDICGESPQQLLIKYRLVRACGMLVKSDLSIGEVAEAVGIADVHYFNRIFKKQFLIPPGQYRKEML